MATMVYSDESESEDRSDRDGEEEGSSEKKGESEVTRNIDEEQIVNLETKHFDGSNLVVKFGWLSLLFLVLFLIWTIIYFQDRQWQLEKSHTSSDSSCSSIWHYGRGIILVTSTGIVGICLVAWYMKPVEKTDFEKRTQQRIEEERKDKEEAAKALFQVIYQEPTLQAVVPPPEPDPSVPSLSIASTACPKDVDSSESEQYSSSSEDEEIYRKPLILLDLGSRLQKYWTMAEDRATITSSAKKSMLCKLTNTGIQELSEFLASLSHLHLQKIFYVKYVESESGNQVVTVAQPFWKHGSLRDLIHNVTDPMADWDKKYKIDSGKPLPLNQIRVFGSQILEAMLYLYKLKFQGKSLNPLKQVQTGNIFIVDDGHCVLGGYENTLLGYRTSVYATLAHHGLLDYADIIMFGHVVYEMCTGRTLTVIFPLEEDYDKISDETCRDIVRYILKTKRGLLCHSIKKIKNMEFFFGSGNKYIKKLKIDMSRRITQFFGGQKKSKSASPDQSDDSAYSSSDDEIKGEIDRSRWKSRSRSADSKGESKYMQAELSSIRKAGKILKSFKKRQKKKTQRHCHTSAASETSGVEHGTTGATNVSNVPLPSPSPSTQSSSVMTTLDPSPEVRHTPKVSISSKDTEEKHMDINDSKLDIDKENQRHSKRCCIIFAVSSILIICLLTLVLLAVMMKANVECLAEVSEGSWWDRTNPFRDYLPR